MNALHRIALIATLLLPLTCATYAQQTSPEKTGTVSTSAQTGTNLPGTMSVQMHPPPAYVPHITGAPYSAEELFDHTQTLVDGTNITQKTRITKVYRDSEGRTRTERPMFFSSSASEALPIVEISDPVSGFRYTLDVQNHIAHRFAPPERTIDEVRSPENGRMASSGVTSTATPPSPTAAAPRVDRPQNSTESLGSQVIEGVYAEGKKVTTTIPVGNMGNDRPIVRVMESWLSPDLKITVLMKNSDPRMGESTMRLRNIDRSEPDPALFRMPSDYKIVNENGEFEMKIARP